MSKENPSETQIISELANNKLASLLNELAAKLLEVDKRELTPDDVAYVKEASNRIKGLDGYPLECE